MTQRYDIYAIGNALVDTEVEVSDAFLEQMGIGKGIMTLVDESRQHELVAALNNESRVHRRASGGSIGKSSPIMQGLLPPSSSVTGVRFSAAARITWRPIEVAPVNSR